MLISDIASLGDKIDIQLVQQLEQQENGELKDAIRTYKSSFFDYVNDKEIEISMPTENGRMVLFQVGLRCRLMFFTKRGLYTCFANVQKRFKRDNFFILQMYVTSEPVKFQRREFFRVDSMIDIQYCDAPKEFLSFTTSEMIFEEATQRGLLENPKRAISVDVSGGGIRFVSEEQFAPGHLLLIVIRLTNEKIDQTFFLLTEVIDSMPSPKVKEKIVTRGQFKFKDLKDRETIVRYVFEEERRIRRKEMG